MVWFLIIFVVFINDIATEIDNHSEINLFPDDAKIFSKSNDALQLFLDNIYQCLKTRKLKSNPNKCQILIYTKANLTPLVS